MCRFAEDMSLKTHCETLLTLHYHFIQTLKCSITPLEVTSAPHYTPRKFAIFVQ